MVVESSVHRAVLFLAIPVVIERMLQMIVGISDVAMVGRLGPPEVASVGLSNQIALVTMNVGAALHVGTTAVVGRCVGANEMANARQSARQAMLLGLVIAISMFGLTLLVSRQSLAWLGAEPDVARLGLPYLRLKALSMVFTVMTMTFAAILRGAGDTRTPMWIGGGVNLFNVGLNYLLIFGHLGFPALGVTGAGVATAVARLLGTLIMIFVFFGRPNPLSMSVAQGFSIHTPTIRRILRVGTPAAGERLLMKAGQLFFTRIVAGLGTSAFAAHQIAIRIESFTFMPGFAIGVAATTLVSQNLGADQAGRAREGAFESTRMGVMLGCLMGLGFAVFAPQIVGLFIPGEPEVIELGARVLRLVALIQPALAANLILAGALRGAGDTRLVMAVNGAAVWFRAGLAYLLVSWTGLGLVGAWLGMALDPVVRSIIYWRHFRRGDWQHLRI